MNGADDRTHPIRKEPRRQPSHKRERIGNCDEVRRELAESYPRSGDVEVGEWGVEPAHDEEAAEDIEAGRQRKREEVRN